jgi:hypothetical protein
LSTPTKLRSSIRILGKNVKVKWIKDAADFGTYSRPLQEIEMELAMPIQLAESTMLHECLEALKQEFRLTLSHDDLEDLEVGLYTVLSDAGVSLRPLVEVKA